MKQYNWKGRLFFWSKYKYLRPPGSSIMSRSWKRRWRNGPVSSGWDGPPMFILHSKFFVKKRLKKERKERRKKREKKKRQHQVCFTNIRTAVCGRGASSLETLCTGAVAANLTPGRDRQAIRRLWNIEISFFGTKNNLDRHLLNRHASCPTSRTSRP